MSRVLIVGSEGQIGSQLSKELSKKIQKNIKTDLRIKVTFINVFAL